jgi:TPR repeat protein
MRIYTLDEIRQCFSTSTDFNEIFDVFQSAIAQRLTDLELYRLLFWNHSLTPDEVRLFGEKLAGEFPSLAYDVFVWLGGMFEATYASSDNHELAVHYYQKAARANPGEAEPYLKVCDCYDPDLGIPSLPGLIEFVLQGLPRVADPVPLYFRLADLYEFAGDPQQSEFYRMKAVNRRGGGPGGTAPVA